MNKDEHYIPRSNRASRDHGVCCLALLDGVVQRVLSPVPILRPVLRLQLGLLLAFDGKDQVRCTVLTHRPEAFDRDFCVETLALTATIDRVLRSIECLNLPILFPAFQAKPWR